MVCKEQVIEILFKYNYKEVLDSINLDELRQVSKVVIEEVKYREYQKLLAEKEVNLKQVEGSAIENRQGTSVVEEQGQESDDRKEESVETTEKNTDETLELNWVNQESLDKSEMGDQARVRFVLYQDEWKIFIEQMEMFFEAKDIKDEKRKARLLIQVDTEAFKLIKQLIAPKS